MEQTALDLEITVMALELIEDWDLDATRVEEWVTSILASLPRIKRLVNKRKETHHAQGQWRFASLR